MIEEKTAFYSEGLKLDASFYLPDAGTEAKDRPIVLTCRCASQGGFWADTAYVNYADAGISEPANAYFGDNAARLAQVKCAYDPDNLFAQPQGY